MAGKACFIHARPHCGAYNPGHQMPRSRPTNDGTAWSDGLHHHRWLGILDRPANRDCEESQRYSPSLQRWRQAIRSVEDDIAAFTESLHGLNQIPRSRHRLRRVSNRVLEDVSASCIEITVELRVRLLQSSSKMGPAQVRSQEAA